MFMPSYKVAARFRLKYCMQAWAIFLIGNEIHPERFQGLVT